MWHRQSRQSLGGFVTEEQVAALKRGNRVEQQLTRLGLEYAPPRAGANASRISVSFSTSVKMRVAVRKRRRRMRAVTSIPSATGSASSIMAMSGVSVTAWEMARRPSSASATTLQSGRDFNVSRMPARTTSQLSAMRIRTMGVSSQQVPPIDPNVLR